jgi:hypothetical protein
MNINISPVVLQWGVVAAFFVCVFIFYSLRFIQGVVKDRPVIATLAIVAVIAAIAGPFISKLQTAVVTAVSTALGG